MSKLNKYLDPNEVPEDDGLDGEFKAIPAGEYTVKVEKAGLNEFDDGAQVWFSTKILAPSCVGRYFFIKFNLEHKNETVQKIGRSLFYQAKVAVGNPSLNETDEFVGKTLSVKVSLRNDKDAKIKNQAALEDGCDLDDMPCKWADSDGNVNDIKKVTAYQGDGVPPPSKSNSNKSSQEKVKKPWQK